MSKFIVYSEDGTECSNIELFLTSVDPETLSIGVGVFIISNDLTEIKHAIVGIHDGGYKILRNGFKRWTIHPGYVYSKSIITGDSIGQAYVICSKTPIRIRDEGYSLDDINIFCTDGTPQIQMLIFKAKLCDVGIDTFMVDHWYGSINYINKTIYDQIQNGPPNNTGINGLSRKAIRETKTLIQLKFIGG